MVAKSTREMTQMAISRPNPVFLLRYPKNVRFRCSLLEWILAAKFLQLYGCSSVRLHHNCSAFINSSRAESWNKTEEIKLRLTISVKKHIALVQKKFFQNLF